MIWGRIDTKSIAMNRRELAKTASEFHLARIVNWILKRARLRTHERVRDFAAEHYLIDILLGFDPLPRVEDDTRLFGESMAAAFEDQLLGWLPEIETANLVAAHDGRDIASLNVFCDAADGLSKTVVIVMNENGESICGGYIDPAWREGTWALDDSKSFLFALKNHAGVGVTKFPKKSREFERGVQVAGPRLVHPHGRISGRRAGHLLPGRGRAGPGGLQRRGELLLAGALGALADRVRACCILVLYFVSGPR
jgi:hypothetical protein